MAELFNRLGELLKEQNLVSNVFSFVDASQMLSKINIWEKRDKAIKVGIDKFNNEVVDKFAPDKQARFGCKGKNKFWYGYKRHIAACMKHGFITKVAVTPANINDSQALKHICPWESMVFADKGYCDSSARLIIQSRRCVNKAILKNNMKEKDKRRDAAISRLRMPFEGIFSKMDKRSRYKSIAKNQFQAFMQALVYNFKKLISLNAPPLFSTPTGVLCP